MSRIGILIDVSKCNGCYNCFLSCRDEHYNNAYPPLSAAQPLDGQFWMRLSEVERGKYPSPKVSYIPIPCMHCRDAPCIDAAKDGAVYRREDGVVVIDPEKAKGQEAIVNACPYRSIYWNAELQTPQKCTLCAHRLDEGEKKPRCIDSCPTGAMVFGSLDDPAGEVAKAVASGKAEVYRPEFGTAPSVLYLGLPKCFVAGEVVLEDDQGECAGGVSVTLKGEGVALETESNDYGDFEFEGLDKNVTYEMTVQKPGYQSFTTAFMLKTDVNFGEIILAPNG